MTDDTTDWGARFLANLEVAMRPGDNANMRPTARRCRALRDLERNRPANVVILPTAASRQIAQPANKAGREARRLARADTAARFNHKSPPEREAERRAEAMQSADAGALIAVAILETLDLETRRGVIARLEVLAGKGPKYRQAADLAATTALNFGEQWDLLRALEALAK